MRWPWPIAAIASGATGLFLFIASVSWLVGLGPIDRTLSGDWIRGDMRAAMQEARRRGVPVMAVLRCVP